MHLFQNTGSAHLHHNEISEKYNVSDLICRLPYQQLFQVDFQFDYMAAGSLSGVCTSHCTCTWDMPFLQGPNSGYFKITPSCLGICVFSMFAVKKNHDYIALSGVKMFLFFFWDVLDFFLSYCRFIIMLRNSFGT